MPNQTCSYIYIAICSTCKCKIIGHNNCLGPGAVFKFDGIQITDIELRDLRKKISIIPQVMCCVH